MHIFVCNFSRHDTQTVELFILPKHRLVLCKFQGSLNISWSVAASFQNKTCTFISMHHICWCCSTNIWMCWRQNIVLNTSKNNAYLWKKNITKPRREIVREPGWTVLNRFEPLIYKHVSAQLIYKNKTTKQQSSFGTLTHTQSNMMHELPGPPVPKRKPHCSKKCFDFRNATGRFCAEEHCWTLHVFVALACCTREVAQKMHHETGGNTTS